jgi:hypothetical protein
MSEKSKDKDDKHKPDKRFRYISLEKKHSEEKKE